MEMRNSGTNLPRSRGRYELFADAVVPALLLSLLGTATPRADGPDDQDIHQTVARISYVSGDVSFSRGDDPDEWQSADLNVPMTLGDRLYTGQDGRVELQIS